MTEQMNECHADTCRYPIYLHPSRPSTLPHYLKIPRSTNPLRPPRPPILARNLIPLN